MWKNMIYAILIAIFTCLLMLPTTSGSCKVSLTTCLGWKSRGRAICAISYRYHLYEGLPVSVKRACNKACDCRPVKAMKFYDDFSSPSLNLSLWKIAKQEWSGSSANYYGSVIPENVEVRNGKLILRANGDLYTGPVVGINKDKSRRSNGKRTGAAIATSGYFASGRYEVNMKIAPMFGVCSNAWTFFFRRVFPGNPLFKGTRKCYRIKHGIQIELPGRPGPEESGFSFSRALMNTFRHVNIAEHTTSYTDIGHPQDDGNFHVYRFDWHTGSTSTGQSPQVNFYVDDNLVEVVTTNVPSYAGRFWIGAWFPNSGTGEPNFNTTQLEVDWVRITPFHEDGDQALSESSAVYGWM